MIRLFLKNLLRSGQLILLLILNLSFGFSGFVAIESFKSSIQNQIQLNSKKFLSADLAVSARRQFTQAEKTKMDQVIKELPSPVTSSDLIDIFAMIKIGNKTRLVSVRAIDSLFPLYGELEFKSGRRVTSTSSKEDLSQNGIYIYPELQAQLELKGDEEVELGKLKLKINEIILKDSSQSFRGVGIAPRVFIHRQLLVQSELIQFGSTLTESKLFQLQQLPADLYQQKLFLDQVKAKLFSVLIDPAIQIDTPETAGEDSGRQLAYLTDFLGLVSLVALFLSILGAIYLLRLDLGRRLKEFAIMKSLGMTPRNFIQFYLCYFAVVGFITCLPTMVFALLIVKGLALLVQSFSTFDLSVTFNSTALIIAFCCSFLGTLLMSLPNLVGLKDIKAAQLFSEGSFQQNLKNQSLILYLPLAIAFCLLSVYQAHSFSVAGIFIGTLAGSFLLLGLAGYFILFKIFNRISWKSWKFKYSYKSLRRRRFSTLAAFISLGLGALLLNLLPQLKVSLMSEFEVNDKSKIPSIFLFDIQDDQLVQLEELIFREEVDIVKLSPMIRARILKINDQDYERSIKADQFMTREEERESRMRNRGVNLTAPKNILEVEILSAGAPFSGIYDESKNKIAELSVEERYAERMKLKLNDLMQFDVQGFEFTGRVINFRKVNWKSFQPNFFIQVQPGLLDEAPKTYIAAIPKLSDEKRNELQGKIVSAFPNISLVDVARLIQDLLKVAEQMSWSLQFMSVLSLILGYTILFSMMRSQLETRKWELNLLKVLGSPQGDLRIYLLFEYFLIGAISAFIGSALSILVGYGISRFIFEGIFVYQLFWPAMTVVMISALSVLLCLFSSQKVLNEKPLALLRSGG